MIIFVINKSPTILIIGFGSIGKRHYRNLQLLGYQPAVFDPDNRVFVGEKAVKRVKTLAGRSLAQFSAAFICNPSDQHVTTALKCARAGCHLFIEKPLSHNLHGIAKLIKICQQKKLTTFVACNFRFDRGFRWLSDLVRRQALGRPLAARVIIGHDLAQSRPKVDYRRTYAATRRSGGVILDSGIHATDYLRALFGEIKKVSGVAGKISALEIAAEDYAAIQLVYEKEIVVSLELDYFSKPKRHSVEIQFEHGWAKWDFANSEVSWYLEKDRKLQIKKSYPQTKVEERRNMMYLEEVKSFLQLLEGKRVAVFQNLESGQEALAIVNRIKKTVSKI